MSETDSDDDSLEFYDAVSENASSPFVEVITVSEKEGESFAKQEENEDGNSDVYDVDDEEEHDHFHSNHTSISNAIADRSRSSSTNDITSTQSLSPSARGLRSGGFGSSIRSLFGSLSNFDLDDLDAEESDEEKDMDVENKEDSDDMRKILREGKKNFLGTQSRTEEQGLVGLGSDKNTYQQQGPPNTPHATLRSSIWNFLTMKGKEKSPDKCDSPKSRRGRGDGDRDKDRDSDKAAPEKKSGVKLSLIGKKKATYQETSVMQELGAHHGPVWVMRFSRTGIFLATGGQDGKAIVWSVGKDRRESCLVDTDEDDEDSDERSPNPQGAGGGGRGSGRYDASKDSSTVGITGAFIFPIPCRIFGEHDGHIVDLSWSVQDFLLTACLDKIVRLWHVKSPACLQLFKHNDLVSSIDFHPSDDRFFVSGCFDKVLRVWDTTKGEEPIKFKEAQDMITAVAFTPDGTRVAVGLFRGQVFFYKTEDLRIETQIVCTKSSAKRKIKYGYKVTGLVFRTINEYIFSYQQHRQHEGSTEYELLVTTNDSSIRLYQVKDLSLTTKFKGYVNRSKPIRASFSNHGHHIICGSDTTGVFIWKVPKRCHMERKYSRRERERVQAISNGERGEGGADGDEEVRDNAEKAKDDQMQARLESMFYSKKYEVYKKYEKLICEDNFKHLCTTVAIFAPPSALREAEVHLQAAPSNLYNKTGTGNGVVGAEEENDEEKRRPFNTVIFSAEINGTIRIIRAKSSTPS